MMIYIETDKRQIFLETKYIIIDYGEGLNIVFGEEIIEFEYSKKEDNYKRLYGHAVNEKPVYEILKEIVVNDKVAYQL